MCVAVSLSHGSLTNLQTLVKGETHLSPSHSFTSLVGIPQSRGDSPHHRPTRMNALKLGDALPHATQANPKSSEDGTCPLSNHEPYEALSEWATGYLSLLADSSCSHGSMQRHLAQLVTRGMADAAKAAQLISSPSGALADMLADAGSNLVMKQLSLSASARPLSHALDWLETQAGESSQTVPLSASPRASADDASTSHDTGCSSTAPEFELWPLRSRRAAAQTRCSSFGSRPCKEEEDLSSHQSKSVTGKAMSVLLSVILSGAINMGGAVAMSEFSSCLQGGGEDAVLPSVTLQQATDQSSSDIKSSSAFALVSAPSVSAGRQISMTGSLSEGAASARVSMSGGIEGVLGGSGLAASTARQLLRADSKLKNIFLPGLDSLLGPALDTLRDSVDEMEASAIDEEMRCHQMHDDGSA